MAKGRNKNGRLKKGYKLTRRGVVKIRRDRPRVVSRSKGWTIFYI